MIEQTEIRHTERQALDELGRNFDQLLARTPEPRAKKTSDRRFVLAGAVAALGALALLAWAIVPGDRIGVDSAVGSISEVAAIQTAPRPMQFVESESVTTNLIRNTSTAAAPPGVGPREFFTNDITQHVWLSMARPGTVQTRAYSEGPGGHQSMVTTLNTNPAPNYRIAGEVYRPAQIAAFARDPEPLMRDIDRAVRKVTPEFRAETKWQYVVAPLRANSPPLPSAVRAELIAALEGIRGVDEAKKSSDPRGRDGLEIKLPAHGLEYSAIFDPEDAQLLYTATTFAEPNTEPFRDAKPGQVLASYTLISARVVDTAPHN